MSDGGAAPWINRILVVLVAIIGLHAIFLLFEGNPRNGIVQFVASVSRLLLLPFVGMFEGQSRVITCLLAILGYCLLAGIGLAINSRVRGARAKAAGEGGRHAKADVDTTSRV